MTYHGEFRGTAAEAHHLHESPPVMTAPLWVLAAGSVFAGLLGVPAALGGGNRFHRLLEPAVGPLPAPGGEAHAGGHLGHLSHPAELGLMALSLAIAFTGIAVAWTLYRRRPALDGDRTVAARLGSYYRLLAGKYYVDELYDRLVVRPLGRLSRAFWKGVDGLLIDGAVHAGAFVTELTGDLVRFSTTGNVRNYVLYFFLGLIVLFWWIVP
jgi:NADH-quinone oxidoreductase subunit L